MEKRRADSTICTISDSERLLAEIDALKARCLTLENIVFTLDLDRAHMPSHIGGPLNLDAQHTHRPLDNLGGHGYQTSNDNLFQIMDQAIAVPTMANDINPVALPSSLNIAQTENYINNMDQATINEDLQDLFGLDASNIPWSHPYDVGMHSSTVQTDFAAPQGVDAPPPVSSFSSDGTTVATPPRSMHHCQHCMRAFSRAGDLRRHALSHNPNATRLSCPRAGCGRQFLRVDKLKDHRARKNH
ncbi:hypothetical protein L207DRAFT_511663 [Hyaloscypha variabilis F]|jgi:hypothetical protein|uniref:C2H2-type domain-containing protein n=1 Tax=Hyaloscypha variabilis (strain UAMH 11265 / GT02V1 / F) TaxID=1149755 RepID=A0A2J6RTQ1_HYAVF|nr:hypothetical protein L207DRAFT_511663 [Hyaloscypha variabilis F]